MRVKPRRLHCEPLEDRRVLAVFVVNDLGDTVDANPGDGLAEDAAGNTTLRAAVEEANALAGSDDITFSVSGMVNLSLGALPVASSMTIDGGNAITVDGGGTSRVMTIDDGNATLDTSTVVIRDIVLTNGNAPRGGAVSNTEMTTLSGVTVSANVADAAPAAFGGGIFNEGTLQITNDSLITGNSAISADSGYSGGIANYGGGATLTLDDSTVSYNSGTKYGGGILSVHGTVNILNGSVVDNNTSENELLYTSGAGIGMHSAIGAAAGLGVAPVYLTIDSSTISNNVLTGLNFPYGSGIYARGYGDVQISNSTITGNRVEGGGGGRGGAGFFYSYFAALGVMTIDIDNTIIDGNYSVEDSGGLGFRARAGGGMELTMTNSMVTNNVAGDGGGAGFMWVPTGNAFTDAVVRIADSTITGNSSGGSGGAFTGGNLDLVINRATIDDNTSGSSGGSLYIFGQYIYDPMTMISYPVPSTVLQNTTISNHAASGSGGAAYIYDSNFEVNNSTISGNSAAIGGAFYQKLTYTYVDTPYESTLYLNSATVYDNTAVATAGGVYGDAYSTPRFLNSIISGNTAATGPDLYLTNAPVTYYSLIGDNSYGGGLAAGNPDANGNLIGDSVTPINAMLSLLMNYGGPTLTHMPMTGSPAINAGDPASMGGTDQRFFERVAEGRIDMGSVETNSTLAVTGDFNFDGEWNCLDIDALVMNIVDTTGNLAFDMNDDGSVNLLDITDATDGWLKVGGEANGLMAFLEADANLDGFVDGFDFFAWNENQGMSGSDLGWCGGDWNADGDVNLLDFNIWNANKFSESSPLIPLDTGGDRFGDASTDSIVNDGLARLSGKRQRLVKEARRTIEPPVVKLDVATSDADFGSTTPKQLASSEKVRQIDSSLTAHQVDEVSESVNRRSTIAKAAADRLFASL